MEKLCVWATARPFILVFVITYVVCFGLCCVIVEDTIEISFRILQNNKTTGELGEYRNTHTVYSK